MISAANRIFTMGFMEFLSLLKVRIVVDLRRADRMHPSHAAERWREAAFGPFHQDVLAKRS
jgi:hypothetical protein